MLRMDMDVWSWYGGRDAVADYWMCVQLSERVVKVQRTTWQGVSVLLVFDMRISICALTSFDRSTLFDALFSCMRSFNALRPHIR